MPESVEGVVVTRSRRNVDVDTPGGRLRCTLRGKFRVTSNQRALVVVGDQVLVSPGGGDEGDEGPLFSKDRHHSGFELN